MASPTLPAPQLTLTSDEARLLTLRAQGLIGADSRRGGVSAMLRRLGAVQLDTISVLARSHELVAYARLGPIGRDRVERAYWHPRVPTAFEYWSHAACVLPIEEWPYYGFRRRALLARGQRWHQSTPEACAAVLARIRAEGPLTATELGGAKKGGPWWDWSDTKIAVEWLLDTGEVICVRRTGWRRIYDLPERALPPELLNASPSDEECLIRLAASAGRALGLATQADLVDYQRLRFGGTGQQKDGQALAPHEAAAANPSSIGADYSGGGYQLAGTQAFGSSPQNWPFSKRSLHPPCYVNGLPTFVELHNVTLTITPGVATYDCRTSYDVSNGAGTYSNGKNCDIVFSFGNASATSCPACFMHRIYAEIDGDWNASGVAPVAPPSPGQMIDVQGFVYWDIDSLNFDSHNWSGWELHPFTAWRPVQSSPVATITVVPPQPSIGQVEFNASISGGVGPYAASWDFGDGSISTGSLLTTHVYVSCGSFIVHLAVTDSRGAGGVSSRTILVSAGYSGGGAGGRMTIT